MHAGKGGDTLFRTGMGLRYAFNNVLQVFLPQNQGQLGLEGFIMGMLYLLFGMSVAVLTYVVPMLASANHRRVMSYGCIAFAAVVFRQIVSIYTWKTGYRWRWYF